MAERRMISKTISISEKVNSLPDVFDMLLYTWIIPHVDDFGRMTGSPKKVKALVVPMLDYSSKDVEAALQHLHEAGLIIWYEVDGDKYLQVTNFEAHQTGLHKRTESKYPDPPKTTKKFPKQEQHQDDIPNDSGNVPEIPLEENRREEKRTEQEGNRREEEEKRTPSSSSTQLQHDPEFANVCRIFQETGFGLPSALIYEELMTLYDEYGPEWLIEAMREAALQNKRRLKYVSGILQNWRAEGGIRRSEKVVDFHAQSKKRTARTERMDDPIQTVLSYTRATHISI